MSTFRAFTLGRRATHTESAFQNHPPVWNAGNAATVGSASVAIQGQHAHHEEQEGLTTHRAISHQTCIASLTFARARRLPAASPSASDYSTFDMAPGELTIRPIVESDTAQICQVHGRVITGRGRLQARRAAAPPTHCRSQVWREGLAQTYEHLEGEKRQLLENYFKADADRATGPGGDLADPVAYWLRGGRGTFLVAVDSTGVWILQYEPAALACLRACCPCPYLQPQAAMQRRPNRASAVPVRAGAVLGCAAIKAGTEMAWGPEEASGCDTASVWRMSVAANARRRGLGRKLMQVQLCCAELSAAGCWAGRAAGPLAAGHRGPEARTCSRLPAPLPPLPWVPAKCKRRGCARWE